MRANAMTERRAESSPRLRARVAGVFYLLVFVMGGIALSVGGNLVPQGDAAATASNVLAHESLFRLRFATDLIATVCYVVVTALFYDLFKPVSRRLSLVAAFISVVGCSIGAASCIFYLAPLTILGGAPYLSAFTPEQLRALALLFFKLYVQAYGIGLVFFGFYCLAIGYLVVRSTFLPRALGVLMAFAGLGWLTFLSPSLVSSLSPYVLAPGIIGEGALTLWLLAMGVDAKRWNEQAAVSRVGNV
jgi:hypothetical protein